MVTVKQLYQVSVMSVLVSVAVIQVWAQEAPSSPPPATIFGPVQRTPPPASDEFLPRFPQHRSSDSERRPWFGPDALTPPARPITPTSQAGRERGVCLRSVPVDPSIDPRFAQPAPIIPSAMPVVVMPPCVQTTEPISRP